MKDSLHTQLHSMLNFKDTEELIEIWRSGDTTEWIDEVFEVAEEILMERLGELPSRSDETQVEPTIREEIEKPLAKQPLDHPLRSDNPRGITDTRARDDGGWDESVAKEHLDQALEYAWDDESENALVACEAAKPVMPDIAEAWNYLGIIYDTLGQVAPAIEAYAKAVQLAPEFSAARQNLRNARVRLEGEDYHRATNLNVEETQALCAHVDQADEAEIIESEELMPGWYYLDETAYLLPGWPGYRTRPGRSGYDQLDSSYELSLFEGVIIRKLITCTMRTRNPVSLLYMTFVGLIFCLPLMMVAELLRGNLSFVFPVIIQLPIMVVGIMLLVNVWLSFYIESSAEDNDSLFSRKVNTCKSLKTSRSGKKNLHKDFWRILQRQAK